MAIITAIDFTNNIAEYLKAAEYGKEFVITKNGKKFAHFFTVSAKIILTFRQPRVT